MGVKSLWSLLTPVGRPVRLETMEGKSMAIDSSIWIYQFQATMRDKDGRMLVNAHVVGFLRRICKLLFYGIKPVFVFDGGAPALKRMTISERKKKKSGAADSHAKIAEKLLAAQLRREAVNQAHGSPSTSKGPPGAVVLNEDTVYLEDIDGTASTPVTPAKDKGKGKASPPKKSRWQDYDPYRLPEVDLDAQVQKHTRSAAPDPRLATEDELRDFIEMMRPEDLDVTSPEFRQLPTEVQYEIIGDLRLKSRQTSHKRLQSMLRTSRSALDFSKAQIQNLKQRNALTQQLLETTDSIGKANVTIPIRIASERNREYVLVKNEGPDGGWVLGIRDDGTQEKPIVIDQDEHIRSDHESDDEDDDLEEVTIASASIGDPNMREYQRERALSGIAQRQATAEAKGRPKAARRVRPKRKPLFIPDREDLAEIDSDEDVEWEEVEDAEMIAATQASLIALEEQEAEELRKAVQASEQDFSSPQTPKTTPRKTPSRPHHILESSSDSDDDLYAPTPSRLATQLKFANTDHRDGVEGPSNSLFSNPILLLPTDPSPPAEPSLSSDDDFEEVPVPTKVDNTHNTHEIAVLPDDVPEDLPIAQNQPKPQIKPQTSLSSTSNDQPLTISRVSLENDEDSSEDDMEEVQVKPKAQVLRPSVVTFADPPRVRSTPPRIVHSTPKSTGEKSNPLRSEQATVEPPQQSTSTPGQLQPQPNGLANTVAAPSSIDNLLTMDSDSEAEGEPWSRPASPVPEGTATHTTAAGEGHWDAAHEMRPHEEESEFAQFVSQVKGRDLDSVRREIDDEIRQLNQQKKAAMRDSEDVTQAMITQIMMMLRLFGIPYITAPMEAEAQCAELVQLGLVDGIITDDSDVFLFGGLRVFKNMFNQSKTVECFLLTDLDRELGLDRDKLVRLAYLLGSDYVEGLPGVGPVVAMELLKEFPGEDGLHKFRDWWTKVQMGRDKEADNPSKFRKRFKKRFKELYLQTDWPNPVVRDAYYHPVVDSSEEPFKWALPDLDGLRGFLREELSWNSVKVDELLQPIIQKMNRRGQASATNRQGLLNDFFSVSAGTGAAEPRKQQTYKSRRLQDLVTEHRKEQARKRAQERETSSEPKSRKRKGKGKATAGTDDDDSVGVSAAASSNTAGSDGERQPEGEGQTPATKKRKKVSAAGSGESTRGARGGGRGRGRGRGTKASTARSRKRTAAAAAASSKAADDEDFVVSAQPSDAPVREIALRARVRPRPAYRGVQSVEESGGVQENTNGKNLSDLDSGSDGSEYQDT